MGVIAKQPFSEFQNRSVALPIAGKQILRGAIADVGILCQTPGVSDQSALLITQWDHNSSGKPTSGAESKPEVGDGFRSEPTFQEVWVLGIEVLQFKIQGRVDDGLRR